MGPPCWVPAPLLTPMGVTIPPRPPPGRVPVGEDKGLGASLGDTGSRPPWDHVAESPPQVLP